MPRGDSDYLVFRSNELALGVRGLFCSKAREQAHTQRSTGSPVPNRAFYKLTAWKGGGVCFSTSPLGRGGCICDQAGSLPPCLGLRSKKNGIVLTGANKTPACVSRPER